MTLKDKVKKLADASRSVKLSIESGNLVPGRGVCVFNGEPVCAFGHVLFRSGIKDNLKGEKDNYLTLCENLEIKFPTPEAISMDHQLRRVARANDFPEFFGQLPQALENLAVEFEKACETLEPEL
jgi:hypothetical protein